MADERFQQLEKEFTSVNCPIEVEIRKTSRTLTKLQAHKGKPDDARAELVGSCSTVEAALQHAGSCCEIVEDVLESINDDATHITTTYLQMGQQNIPEHLHVGMR